MLLGSAMSVVASTGALVTIFLIGFDPFVQQLLIFPVRLVHSDLAQASIPAPFAYDYSPPTSYSGSDVYLSALTGVFGKTPSLSSRAFCPGGNCEWPKYHALALCSDCSDVTSEVSVSGEIYDMNMTEIAWWVVKHNNITGTQVPLNVPVNYTATYSFKTGASVNLSLHLRVDNDYPYVQYSTSFTHRAVWSSNLGDINTNNWASLWSRLNIAGVDGPLLGINYIDLDMQNSSRLTVTKAYECLLTPCVREYQTAMIGGKITSKILSTNYGHVLDAPNDIGGSNWTSVINGTTFYVKDPGAAGSAGAYVISGYVEMLVRGLYHALVSTTTYQSSGFCELLIGVVHCHDNGVEPAESALGDAWSSTSAEIIDTSPNSFPQILDNVALTITDLFQQYSERNIIGSVLEAQTYVVVRWIWLIYPTVLVVMGSATLLLTIYQTKRSKIGVWKSSILPLLCRDSGSLNTADIGDDGNRISRIDVLADRERVKLTKMVDTPEIWVLEKQG